MRIILCLLVLFFPLRTEGEGVNQLNYQFYFVPTIGQEWAEFTLMMKNNGNIPLHFHFPTSQRMNLTILDSSGKEVYDYSKGRYFLKKIQTITVKPHSSFRFREKWNYQYKGKRVPKGEYTVNIALVPKRINDEQVGRRKLTSSQKIFVPEENKSFRLVRVEGKHGDYRIKGESKTANGWFYYSVEDGHQEYITEKQVVTSENINWEPFSIAIHIPKENLPDNGSLIINLYERSKDGKIIDTYPVILERFNEE